MDNKVDINSIPHIVVMLLQIASVIYNADYVCKGDELEVFRVCAEAYLRTNKC